MALSKKFRSSNLSRLIRSKSGLLLITTIALGLWFKSQAFLYETFAFTYDVGRDLLAVSNIVETFKIPLIGYTTGMPGIFYGPTWYYILTPVYILSGGDPRGISLFMALTGVATAILGFMVGKKIGGFVLGFIILLLISVSQVLTEISSQIWNPNLIPLFMSLLFVLLFKNIKLTHLRSRMFFLIIGFILGIVFDLEIVFGILFGLSVTLYLLIFHKLYQDWKIILFFIAGITLPQIPRLIFELRHNFLMLNTLFSSISKEEGESIVRLYPDFVDVLRVFFELFSYSLAFDNKILGGVFLVALAAIFLKAFSKYNMVEKQFLFLLLIILLIFILGLGFFNHDLESHYYIGISFIFILLMSLAVYSLHKFLRVNFYFFVILIVACAVSINQGKILGTFQENTWVGDASVYRNQLEVIKYIYADANGNRFNTATYTPPIFDYPYQYIFKWYGQKKFGYQPTQDKAELFYLIIEPDLQLPERQNEWLEVREGDGTVISEKTFPSGIKVQKRVH